MPSLFLMLVMQAGVGDILVTGKRLDDAYSECVQKSCPPLRDAQVTIAWAEREFRNGAYLKAKNALAAGVGRNRGFAKTDPKPVAALYEAYATVAAHDGDMAVYKRAVGGQVNSLRENLPANDPAVASAGLALGDMWVKLGKAHSADLAYRSAERHAIENGQPAAALLAASRRIWLTAALGENVRAEKMLAELASRPGAEEALVHATLLVMKLRLAAKRGDDDQVKLIAASLGANKLSAPVLIASSDYEQDAASAGQDAFRKFGDTPPRTSTGVDLGPIRWVDVGFWIRPDGHTDDAQVLRGSSGGWTAAVLSQITSRRYAQAPSAADAPGIYRIERFTSRGTYRVPNGSLVRQRGGARTIETLDLSEQPSTSAH